jgi:endonuclease III
MMDSKTLNHVLKILQKESAGWNVPIVTLVAQRSADPYQVLVSTLLSLRTKDEVTSAASRRLLDRAETPEQMLRLKSAEIRRLIYPVGFYKRKADTLLQVSKILMDMYSGHVPDDLEELLRLPGVGRKTANLVLTLGFGKPGICVDTHVHRISNRLGYVRTKSPDETETVLREKLSKAWWIPINDILVAFGQGLCRPVSPWCSRCPVSKWCERIGVSHYR